MIRNVRKRLYSRTGASFVFALTIFLILSVLSAVIVNSALTNAMRSREDRESEQAYLTVISAADTFLDWFEGRQDGAEVRVIATYTEKRSLDTHEVISSDIASGSIESSLYSGWDVQNSPFGADTASDRILRAAARNAVFYTVAGEIADLEAGSEGKLAVQGTALSVADAFSEVGVTVRTDGVAHSGLRFVFSGDAGDGATYTMAALYGSPSVTEDIAARSSALVSQNDDIETVTVTRQFLVRWDDPTVAPMK